MDSKFANLRERQSVIAVRLVGLLVSLSTSVWCNSLHPSLAPHFAFLLFPALLMPGVLDQAVS